MDRVFIGLAFGMSAGAAVLSLLCHVSVKKADEMQEALVKAVQETIDARMDLDKSLNILKDHMKSDESFQKGLVVTVMDLEKRISKLENAPKFEVLKKEEEDG